ncbi:MAG: hypothetical protein HKN45_05390 [Flavobacteriales bacterium]|nr:hypothetical protein [Flavobacteriales bacterium]
MLKFFRKIRKDLMEKNRTGKYLKYAIGEIALVMVGILLALQVNNWNEYRKLENTTQHYLHSLLTDLEEDSLNLADRIIFSDERVAEYEAYVAAFDSSDITIQEVIGGLTTVSPETSTLTYKTNTIEILKSTGDIKLIPHEIRDRIIDLNSSQEYSDFVIKRNLGIFIEDLWDVGKLGWSGSAVRLSRKPTMGALVRKHMWTEERTIEIICAVEAIYANKYDTEKIIKDFYEAQLLDISEIRALIKSELN